MSLSTRTLHRLATALGRGSAAEIDDALSAGGDVDLTALLPLDGSRSANVIDIAGVEGDPLSGVTLEWDNSVYGLVLKGRAGSADGELYTVNADDPTNFGNLSPYGLTIMAADNAHTAFLYANADHAELRLDQAGLKSSAPGLLEINMQWLGGGESGLVCRSADGTAYKLVPPNGGGAAIWVAA